jgi:cytochrome c-type biogenesis protein CcmH
MIKYLTGLIVAALVTAASIAAPAPDERMEDAALEVRARGLYVQLRCVICQSQSIDESNAHLAVDMRAVVRTRLEAGDSDQEILDYMQARYGDYVLMMPPFQRNTLLLWLSPLLVLLLGGGFAVLYVRRQSGHTPESVDDEDEARVAALLDEEGQS